MTLLDAWTPLQTLLLAMRAIDPNVTIMVERSVNKVTSVTGLRTRLDSDTNTLSAHDTLQIKRLETTLKDIFLPFEQAFQTIPAFRSAQCGLHVRCWSDDSFSFWINGAQVGGPGACWYPDHPTRSLARLFDHLCALNTLPESTDNVWVSKSLNGARIPAPNSGQALFVHFWLFGALTKLCPTYAKTSRPFFDLPKPLPLLALAASRPQTKTDLNALLSLMEMPNV